MQKKKKKVEYFLIAYMKTNSKQIKDLSVKMKNHNTPRRKYRHFTLDINLSNIYMDLSPQDKENKSKQTNVT